MPKRKPTWNEKFAAYKAAYPELAAEYERRMAGELPADWAKKSAAFVAGVNDKAESLATRQASLKSIEGYAPLLPELFGGSADLGCSNLTEWSGYKPMRAATPTGQLRQLRRARIRHVRHHERHRPARRVHSVRRHLPDVLGIRTQCPAHGRADEDAEHLRLYARFHRSRRRRPDPPGG